MGCTSSRKRGSSAWLTRGLGRWFHPLLLKPGLWESCSEGTGHLCPEYGSWLPRWRLGQPRTVEVSVKVFLFRQQTSDKPLVLLGEDRCGTCSPFLAPPRFYPPRLV